MFSYFPHGVGEPFELESGDLRNCIQLKSFSSIGACFTVFAEVLVRTLKFINCEITGDSLMQSTCSLALLTYPPVVQC